jgi:5'-methylthioinosine phosphorylase
MLAIIGGSGLDQWAQEEAEGPVLETPYGQCSAAIEKIRQDMGQALFLPRHGRGHTLAPHKVNYRANLWALREAGAQKIVAVCAVGSIRDVWTPGTLVLPDQIIDYTWGRKHTYFDDNAVPPQHVDFTNPFSEALINQLSAVAAKAQVSMKVGGIYGATQGPRLESAAEINRLAHDGVDLVGMTGMPEAALARELALEYVILAVVANPAAGRGKGSPISLSNIQAVLGHAMIDVKTVLAGWISLYGH